MGKKLVVLCLLLCSVTAHGESFLNKHDPWFNFGVKGGLNAMKPHVSSFRVNDVNTEGMYVYYRVGYSVDLFTRLNMGRFFLQTGAMWEAMRCSFRHFDLPSDEAMAMSLIPHTLQVKSVSVPISFGYYLVKAYPYALNFRVGTKKSFRYDVVYSSDESNYLIMKDDRIHPIFYDLSLFSVLEVEIGRFVFDIGYELGLNGVNYQFEQASFIKPAPLTSVNMRMEGLSMSVGIFF